MWLESGNVSKLSLMKILVIGRSNIQTNRVRIKLYYSISSASLSSWRWDQTHFCAAINLQGAGLAGDLLIFWFTAMSSHKKQVSNRSNERAPRRLRMVEFLRTGMSCLSALDQYVEPVMPSMFFKFETEFQFWNSF